MQQYILTDMPTLHVMAGLKSEDPGDKRIQWEKDDKNDLAKAKKIFREKIKEGYMAFGYIDRSIGKAIRKFAPSFDRILMVPPMAGG